MTKKIEIVQVLDPPSNRPFMLVETYQTSDGLRTRVCGNRWRSLIEAMAEQKERMENAATPNELAIEAEAIKRFDAWKKDFLDKQTVEEYDRDLPGVLRGS